MQNHRSHLHVWLLSLAGVVLTWVVVRTTLVAYLADANPEFALSISPSDGRAAIALADLRLRRPLAAKAETTGAPAKSSADTSKVAARAAAYGIPADIQADEVAALNQRVLSALGVEPLSARGMRIMAQLAGYQEQDARGIVLFDVAASLSKHEYLAGLYLTMHSMEERKWEAAMSHADVLMRARADMIETLTPLVVHMLETAPSKPFAMKALSKHPSWRPNFVQMMIAHVKNPTTPFEVYQELRSVGIEPSQEELTQYLRFLINKNLDEYARNVWLLLLPFNRLAHAGFVFNGSFDLPSRSVPFDWFLPSATGARVEIDTVPGENGNRALKIEFITGRVELGDIHQRLTLLAGSYRLTGRYRGEVSGPAGMRWTVSCANRASDRLAETPVFIGKQAAWRNFDLTFTIPQNCPTQILRVLLDARFAAEQLATGLIWYDDISISRNAFSGTPELQKQFR